MFFYWLNVPLRFMGYLRFRDNIKLEGNVKVGNVGVFVTQMNITALRLNGVYVI